MGVVQMGRVNDQMGQGKSTRIDELMTVKPMIFCEIQVGTTVALTVCVSVFSS